LTINQKEQNQKYSGLLSWVIFLATLVVVLITLTTVIFPSLILGSINEIKYPLDINLYETGIFAYPLLITNFILLGIGILYLKNKVPVPILKSIKFILRFEVSSKLAFFVVIILLGTYITFSVGEVFEEDPWPDFNRQMKPDLEKWDVQSITAELTRAHVVLFLGNLSMQIFGSYRVIPFIGSILLLILTYFFTTEIAKKRFAGIVSMGILLQSGIFLTYDTVITYTNFWILFYLFSLYTIYKKWPLSPISYILSIFSKALTITFFPMTLFFIYRANIAKRKKILLVISFSFILAIGSILLFTTDSDFVNGVEFNSHKFLAGFTAFSSQLRFDGLIVIFLLPLTIGLFIASRNGVATADSILVLILGIILLAPILPSVTELTNNPYRFVTLIVFFAIGVGTLLAKRS